ncbi:MAG: chemotaxis protein CheW [Coriobacteriia bacterium]
MEPAERAGERQFVIFRLSAEHYGLPIEKVRSIIRYEESTPVPRAPAFVEGVINLRGKVIPVVDLGSRLLGTTGERDSASRIIVAEGEAGTVGLSVDATLEVATIPAADIRPAPETALVAETADAFEGVADTNGRLIIILNLDKALPRSDYVGIAAQEGGLNV